MAVTVSGILYPAAFYLLHIISQMLGWGSLGCEASARQRRLFYWLNFDDAAIGKPLVLSQPSLGKDCELHAGLLYIGLAVMEVR